MMKRRRFIQTTALATAALSSFPNWALPQETLNADQLIGQGTPELIEKIERWSKKLGKFPHKKWLPNLDRKKQSTRMIKAYCTHIESDYIVRLSRTTLIKHGTPRCPVQVLNHDNELEICNSRLGTDDPELNDLLYQTLLNQGMTD